MIRNLFVCSCEDVSHQFVIGFEPSIDFNDSVFIEVHLNKASFFRRLQYAFLYLLGKQSKFNGGAFSEIILNKKQVKELIQTLYDHYDRMR
jgi:hypothetical protein